MHLAICSLLLVFLLHPPNAPAFYPSALVGRSSLPSVSGPSLLSPHNLEAAEIINYRLPGSTVVIRFILGQPLPQIVMSDTILSAYSYIAATMALDGDNILPQEEDPFIYNKLYGAKFEAFSADETLPRRLTWGHLEGTVLGLYNGLYLRGKYKTALFYIHDTVGVVGMGELQVDKVDFKANTTLQIHHLPLEQPSLR